MDFKNGNNNPIVTAGSLIYNGVFDMQEALDRQKRFSDQQTKFPGPVGDEELSIKQHEITIARRNHVGDVTRNQNPFVLSTLNGAGHKHEPLWQFIQNHYFTGIATNDFVANTKMKNTSMTLSLRIGGLETIRNGPLPISPGDECYWDVPDIDDPYEKNGSKRWKRIPIIVMPYKHGFDNVTKISISKVIFDDLPENYRREKAGLLVQSAENLITSMKTMFMLSIHLAAKIGLIDTNEMLNDPDWFSSTNMKNRARNYEVDKDGKKLLLRILGANLKLTEEKVQTQEITKRIFGKNVSIYNDLGEEIRTTLRDVIMKSLLLEDDTFMMCPCEKGSKVVPKGWEGDIHNAQVNLISDLFTSFTRANESKRSRIFGKALSGALPHDLFDINLNYA